MIAFHSSNESAFNKKSKLGASGQYGHRVMAAFFYRHAQQLNWAHG